MKYEIDPKHREEIEKIVMPTDEELRNYFNSPYGQMEIRRREEMLLSRYPKEIQPYIRVMAKLLKTTYYDKQK